jgi:hypothetical protein
LFDVNPLAHSHYLADIERAARRRPGPSGRRAGELAARAIEEARRLIRSLRMREAGRA